MKIGASGRARTQRIVSGLYWRLHLTVSLRALVACSVLQFLARRKRRMVASDKNDGISAVIWLPRSSRTFFICRFEIERLYIIFEKLWLTVLVSSPLFAVDIYIYISNSRCKWQLYRPPYNFYTVKLYICYMLNSIRRRCIAKQQDNGLENGDIYTYGPWLYLVSFSVERVSKIGWILN